MKLLSTLTLAALMTAGAAFAATDAKPTATPAASATPAHASTKHCTHEANAKKLMGDEKAQFIKDCKAGKKPA
jgi:hypothetical protein